MEKTILAKDLEICRILNGMWQVAGAQGQIDTESVVTDMEEYHKSGFTTWDLADIYGPSWSFDSTPMAIHDAGAAVLAVGTVKSPFKQRIPMRLAVAYAFRAMS